MNKRDPLLEPYCPIAMKTSRDTVQHIGHIYGLFSAIHIKDPSGIFRSGAIIG
jgi:hypothetical protein